MPAVYTPGKGTTPAGIVTSTSVDADHTALDVVVFGAFPVPVGAATAALQTAGNASLSSIDATLDVPLSTRASEATQLTLLTDAQLRATPVPVSGTVTATGPLTDAQLRATPVPVSGTVATSNGLTDAQLRATAVPVSGPLTDAQLRATPVPVSGTVTSNIGTTAGLALDATLVGGMQSTQITDGVTNAAVTAAATAATALDPALVVAISPNNAPSASASTDVASSAFSVTILAANVRRKMATIFNNSNKDLYIKLDDAAPASLTSFWAKLVPNALIVIDGSKYNGIILGIWSSANGFARVGEAT